MIQSSIIVLFVTYEVYSLMNKKKQQQQQQILNANENENMVKIIVLGCGCSGATPLLSCILGLFPNKPINGK